MGRGRGKLLGVIFWRLQCLFLFVFNLVTVNGIQPRFLSRSVLKSIDFVDCWSGHRVETLCLVTGLTSKHKRLRTQQRHQCTRRRDFRRLLALTSHASIPTYHTPPGISPASIIWFPRVFLWPALQQALILLTISVSQKWKIGLFSKFSARRYLLRPLQPPKRPFIFVYLSTFAGIPKICYTKKWEEHPGFQCLFPWLSLGCLGTVSAVPQRRFPRECPRRRMLRCVRVREPCCLVCCLCWVTALLATPWKCHLLWGLLDLIQGTRKMLRFRFELWAPPSVKGFVSCM